MKRFFHLLVIFLLALLVAGWYEIFYIRGGQLPTNNPLDDFVQERWGWSSILWFGNNKDTDSDTDAPSDDLDPSANIADAPTDDTNLLLEDYSVGKYETADLNGLGLWELSGRYAVIEYCTHSSQLCNDAVDQQVNTTIADGLDLAGSLVRRPFVNSASGVDAQIRLWESCVPSDMVDAYHTALYEDTPTDTKELVLLAKKLKIDDFQECIEWWSARLYITQQMKQANELFGISRIPSYVIIDTETSLRYTIPGLYTESEIEEFLESEVR